MAISNKFENLFKKDESSPEEKIKINAFTFLFYSIYNFILILIIGIFWIVDGYKNGNSEIYISIYFGVITVSLICGYFVIHAIIIRKIYYLRYIRYCSYILLVFGLLALLMMIDTWSMPLYLTFILIDFGMILRDYYDFHPKAM